MWLCYWIWKSNVTCSGHSEDPKSQIQNIHTVANIFTLNQEVQLHSISSWSSLFSKNKENKEERQRERERAVANRKTQESSSSNQHRIKIQVTLKNELKKEKINLGKIKTPNQSSMETMKKWIKLKTLAGVKEDVGK